MNIDQILSGWSSGTLDGPTAMALLRGWFMGQGMNMNQAQDALVGVAQLLGPVGSFSGNPTDVNRRINNLLLDAGITRNDAITVRVPSEEEPSSPGEMTVGGAEYNSTQDPSVAIASGSLTPTGEDFELAREVAPRDVFERFIASDPRFSPLNPMGTAYASRQFNPAFTAFTLSPSAPASTFQQFLEQGGGALNPEAGAARMVSLANMFNAAQQGTATTDQKLLADTFAERLRQMGESAGAAPVDALNRGAFEAGLTLGTNRINPLFQRAARAAAERQFQSFQANNPETSFLQFLANRGGSIFGSGGNPTGVFSPGAF